MTIIICAVLLAGFLPGCSTKANRGVESSHSAGGSVDGSRGHDPGYPVFETESEDHARGDGAAECRWSVLSREVIRHYLDKGPAALLGDLDLSRYPESRDEDFFGWKVDAVRDPCIGAALKRGDVLKSLNGRSIRTPSDLWNIWRGLSVADELSIKILRGGVVRELVFTIRPNL